MERSRHSPSLPAGKPRIVAISSPLYVRQDEVINLTCKAIAFPRPSVHWNINGTVRAGRGLWEALRIRAVCEC